MSDELKPCPFCGGPASIHKGMQAFDDFEVHCDPCGMCGPNFGSMGETLTPKEDAIAAWNTRADLAEELAAALRDLLTAVCGETGFAQCVRDDSDTAYPWPALDDAEEDALAALAAWEARK